MNSLPPISAESTPSMWLTLIFVVLITLHPFTASPQRLRNASRTTIGYIEEGRVQNANRSTLGYIENGRIMNASRSTLGYFEKSSAQNSNRFAMESMENGRVLDANHSAIGYLENGRVLNAGRSTLGYVVIKQNGKRPGRGTAFLCARDQALSVEYASIRAHMVDSEILPNKQFVK